MRTLRLGTRGSPLALWQAHMVAARLRAAHGLPEDAVAIVPIRTTGDRVQDRALAEIGGKALWTKELDRALLAGEIDCAVHSMKDVETIRPAEIVIAAMPPRADVRDRLIGADSLAALPPGARVGTSSPRRAAQVRRARPDATILLFRGNVDTRLAKLAAGEADATLLAAAGLDRLDKTDIGHALPIDTMLPAPAQGAVGVEARADDHAMLALLAAIDDAATSMCVRAERDLLAALGADCRSPVAAVATVADGGIHLRAEILSEDGALWQAGETRFAAGDADAPARLAADLLRDAAPPLRALFTP
ncbi:hydroxymethylbilane synthase [Sphingomonas nostoxanthinifaciens]|uniref:hydroxymethylbilane synthase n=1 Tax=Sphingomonas nostoxanthinifaciens TaxID=2872652 RepID=UPI001CC1FD0E|nr:hydroxymethylbilane synthase [Sphingomonas nostoxanthinifaciens]UAK24398.1 hydroxymethylbilane synthase [Sphingomonas nostoxanthinifaciens]